MYEKEIELKIRELPEDLRKEVLDYVEFLLKKYKGKEIKANRFKFDSTLTVIGQKYKDFKVLQAQSSHVPLHPVFLPPVPSQGASSPLP